MKLSDETINTALSAIQFSHEEYCVADDQCDCQKAQTELENQFDCAKGGVNHTKAQCARFHD